MSYPYPQFNAVDVPYSDDRREGVAADSTGSPSGASQSAPQRVFSHRLEQDTLPFLSMSGHDLQVPPLTRMFSSSSSLTLPQPTAFNTDGYHRQHVPSGYEHHETRSEFRIVLPPLIGLDCDSPPTNPPYPDNDTYLRRQLEWKEDTPVNLESLPDPEPDQKPPYTLPILIQLAIQGSQKNKLTLGEIYRALEARFEYFRHEKSGAWKGSIRHNLSLNKVFKKTPRPITEAGRGDYWELDFSQGEGYKRERKRRKKGPSAQETETMARQLGEIPKKRKLSSASAKSPGQQSIGLQRPARRRATSQSHFSPYPVGEHSRTPSLAWAHSTANDYAVDASRTEIGVLGYDGAWHAQQPSSSTQTHHSIHPHPSSTPFVSGHSHFSGAIVPSPFVSGRGSEQLASTAVTLDSQFGSGRWVLPPLDVPGVAGDSRYHPFNEWELDEVQGGQLRHGISGGDCQDRLDSHR